MTFDPSGHDPRYSPPASWLKRQRRRELEDDEILPGRRWAIAIGASLGVLIPLVQWWYVFGRQE